MVCLLGCVWMLSVCADGETFEEKGEVAIGSVFKAFNDMMADDGGGCGLRGGCWWGYQVCFHL